MNIVSKPKLFKFLGADAVPFMLDGSIQFGSLRKYRLLELLTGDAWIGDRREGIETTMLPNGPGFRNNSRVLILDAYVLSLSQGEFEDLVDGMTATPTAYTYDGCIEITNFNSFTSRLNAAPFEDSTVGEKFHISAAPCEYIATPEIHQMIDDVAVEPDPFTKAERYAPQREFRVMLRGKGEMRYKDHVRIQIGDCSRFMEQRPLPEGGPAPDLFSLSIDEAMKALTDLYHDWEKVWSDDFRDIDDMAGDFGAQISATIGKAYGSLRFSHGYSNDLMDLILSTRPMTDMHVYNQLRNIIRDYASGQLLLG
jgi:hypothetical protein